MELGFMEMVVIALAIIVLFGPDKLPSIARDLGSGVRKMRGAMDDIKTEILKETHEPVSEIKKEIDKVKMAAKEYTPVQEIKQEIEDLKKATTMDTNSLIKEEGTEKTALPSFEDPTHEGPVSRRS